MTAIESFVLRFTQSSTGALQCRATDIFTRKTWMVADPAVLYNLLSTEPGEHSEGSKE
ncbi:MAG TPA: hypothetical protein VFL13_09185 [Candidatus Baltobacteraceae bacterium]|nr:hypothetical protein [Candidatus Baltobacteraceae bacterium]